MNYSEIEDRVPGFLTQIEITDKERDNMLDYMAKAYPKSYVDFIYSLLGDKYLMFFDVLEGLSLRVPSRSSMARIVSHVKIYTYLKNRDFTDEAVTNASLIFRKREQVIRDIYNNINSVINSSEYSEDDTSEYIEAEIDKDEEEQN